MGAGGSESLVLRPWWFRKLLKVGAIALTFGFSQVAVTLSQHGRAKSILDHLTSRLMKCPPLTSPLMPKRRKMGLALLADIGSDLLVSSS